MIFNKKDFYIAFWKKTYKNFDTSMNWKESSFAYVIICCILMEKLNLIYI
jgi:hypothetical protein